MSTETGVLSDSTLDNREFWYEAYMRSQAQASVNLVRALSAESMLSQLQDVHQDHVDLKSRLADNEKLEWFVFEIFYANPIAFARKNLVIALQRYLLGLPLTTPEEEQRKMLDAMSDEDRAEWWRAENARRLAVRGVTSA